MFVLTSAYRVSVISSADPEHFFREGFKPPTLTTFHALSSDLPFMRFFFISARQKIFSLSTGSETVSELTFSPNVLHYETLRVILFVLYARLQTGRIMVR